MVPAGVHQEHDARVRYWARVSEATARNLPARSSRSTFGRVVIQRDQAYVYPPATGWPVRRAGSPMLVDVVHAVWWWTPIMYSTRPSSLRVASSSTAIRRSRGAHAVFALMASVP